MKSVKGKEVLKPLGWLFMYGLLLSFGMANGAAGETVDRSQPMPDTIVSASPISQAPSPAPILRGIESRSSPAQAPAMPENMETASSSHSASVESYFMCGPNRETSLTGCSQSQSSAINGSSTSNESQSHPHKSHGFFWHVLDNLGIPMFGRTAVDAEIDPSIETTYSIPCPKLPSQSNVLKVVNETAAALSTTPLQTASHNAQPTQQKIPESELEGTIYETRASKDMQAPVQ